MQVIGVRSVHMRRGRGRFCELEKTGTQRPSTDFAHGRLTNTLDFGVDADGDAREWVVAIQHDVLGIDIRDKK